MRPVVLCLAAILLSVAAPVRSAAAPSGIHDVDITVNLKADGTAAITEVWDITANEGTEWYLVRDNLGDIVVGNLSVRDETGLNYVVEDEWDSDRSRAEKTGRCGILHKRKGVEICWGIGDYGDRKYIVHYTMSNAVKSLQDADMLHLQLLSPGLSSTPEHVSVSITARSLSKEDVRFWGFGFEGRSAFEDGAVVMESSGRIGSVIVLLRFEKGIFSSSSVQDRGFEDVLAEALEGAEFEDEGNDSAIPWSALLFTLFGGAIVATAVGSQVVNKRKILGCKPSEVHWSRETPFEGDLRASNYTLTRLGEVKKANSFASALILRMIYDGAILVNRKDEGKVDLSFNDAAAASLDESSRSLYDMMKTASGDDLILQDKEFSRWSKKNYKKVNNWIETSSRAGRDSLREKSQMKLDKYTAEGQAEARKLLGFKKFLSDFTLVGERSSRDVALWQDYLVFASLYGIADQVAKELHDIDPQFFEEVTSLDYDTTRWLLWHNNYMASSITNAQARAAEAMGRSSGSFGGFGGGTSFGGGGGFSGGGFGGGAR